MKVLFISRSTLFTVKGGDTVQVVETAKALREKGVQVDISLAGDVNEASFQDYDLLHFFNLIRPADILRYANAPIPKVISPVYVDYSEYDRHERTGVGGFLARNVTPHTLEYLKAMGRFVKGQDKIASSEYLLGHKRAMIKAVRSADWLLPNSNCEAERLSRDLELDFSFTVVPYAVDQEIFYRRPEVDKQPRLVLCVGQIEGRKNQHRLIEATRDIDVDLVLIGRPSPNNVDYFKHCKRISHERATFIDFISQDELSLWYNRAAVHVLPSWFETAGLSSLEAAACGCEIVVADRGDTQCYFNGHAHFCTPDSTVSIRNAVERALASNLSESFSEVIAQSYTWAKAASATLDAYKKVIG